MKYFECINLQKKYNERKIDFSFECEKNTLTAIVGPSGSGKSTVLKIIAGLIKSDSEKTKIILNEKEIQNLEPNKRNLGMVFQSPSLFLNMNVAENITFGLRCKGMHKKESFLEASKFLEKFNLQGFEKRLPHTLSGGEAQRVSLARTLIVKPNLLLLDEPLSALDAPLRKKLGDEILNIQKEMQLTTIMVTHDIEEAKRMADQIILMKNGTNVWQGPSASFNDNLLF